MDNNQTVTFFNRHQSMEPETRSFILKTISKLHDCDDTSIRSVNAMANWLYGTFDGYDYSGVAIYSKALAEITHYDPDLGAEISEIFGIIEKYPRTPTPNNNHF